MCKEMLKSGIYPVMLTPYGKNGEVDYAAAGELAKWYIQKGCQGIFAACLSSEIYFLSEEERLGLIDVTVKAVPDGADIIASGHCTSMSVDPDGTIRELKKVAERGVRAVVLIACKLAEEKDGEQTLIDNAMRIADAVPDMDLGLYEAPHPYHRLISPEALGKLAHTGRFVFFKDTCCDPVMLHKKLEAVKGTRLKLFNANSATLLDSLKHGASGYSGVMCNYHPEFYVRLWELFASGKIKEAEYLQNYLGMTSLVQYQMYPLNAKYYLMRSGLPIESYFCRSREDCELTVGNKLEVEQVLEFDRIFAEKYLPN